jgi:acetyl esterase/lipase
MIADWDDAYSNSDHIPDGTAYPDRWRAAAAAFRGGCAPDRLRPGLAYGMHARERLDLFLPEAGAAGLLVFIHGGYWMRFDRSVWSHLAAGPLARGWAVAMPSYPLAPEARIAAITRSARAAIEAAAAAVPGPVVLAGHSAGGHLVARQVCTDTGLKPATLRRIRRVVPISGVHDLRPLMATKLNATLRLDPAEAAAESPALLAPLPGTRMIAWVGGAERPEFVRQTRLLANIWTGLGADVSDVIAPERHHFDVIEALADPGSDLVQGLLGD